MMNKKETLLQLITDEQQRKQEREIIPHYTTSIEAAQKLGISKQEVLDIAKVLERAEKIRIGRTVCDEYFEYIQS